VRLEDRIGGSGANLLQTLLEALHLAVEKMRQRIAEQFPLLPAKHAVRGGVRASHAAVEVDRIDRERRSPDDGAQRVVGLAQRVFGVPTLGGVAGIDYDPLHAGKVGQVPAHRFQDAPRAVLVAHAHLDRGRRSSGTESAREFVDIFGMNELRHVAAGQLVCVVTKDALVGRADVAYDAVLADDGDKVEGVLD
jgi:hypothetical protein